MKKSKTNMIIDSAYYVQPNKFVHHQIHFSKDKVQYHPNL